MIGHKKPEPVRSHLVGDFLFFLRYLSILPQIVALYDDFLNSIPVQITYIPWHDQATAHAIEDCKSRIASLVEYRNALATRPAHLTLAPNTPPRAYSSTQHRDRHKVTKRYEELLKWSLGIKSVKEIDRKPFQM